MQYTRQRGSGQFEWLHDLFGSHGIGFRQVGDHVTWNSEAGQVTGTIIKVHTSDFPYKGHTRRASEDEPQYEIKSDKTDHIAAHKEGALSKSE